VKIKHLNKTENTSTKDANIKELKQRFKIVEAEIQAGNNNPVVKTELLPKFIGLKSTGPSLSSFVRESPAPLFTLSNEYFFNLE
jgi:hypothetical protein